VALLSVLRRWHHRDGMPIREISRRTGLSRNTVRKYLASGVVEPKYPKRKTPSKIDDYSATLNNWLHRESGRHRKQRRSVKQLYYSLVELGYTGSYDRVAAFARDWRQDQQAARNRASSGTYVPLIFAPGEAFQFDWSEDYAVLGGQNTKLQIAHFKLSHSRGFYLRAYFLQTHEMLFDAHQHAFRVFGGIPERGIYDNMKTAVDKVGRGKVRVVNARFQAMVPAAPGVNRCSSSRGTGCPVSRDTPWILPRPYRSRQKSPVTRICLPLKAESSSSSRVSVI